MDSSDPRSWTPPWKNLPLEGRAVYEYLRMRFLPRDITDYPRGQGEPVLLIPGFGQSDQSTAPLKDFLTTQGFSAYGWGEGRHLGSASGRNARLLQLISQLYETHQQPVTLVGWSLGGVIARELARKQPQHVQRVISLGSPLAGGHTTTLQPLFARLNPGSPKTAQELHSPARYAPPPVPCTAVYTRSDGIVAWQSAREPASEHSESIEVPGAHMGLGFNPSVWYIICYRTSIATRDTPFAWRE